jgi:hypothetical protein
MPYDRGGCCPTSPISSIVSNKIRYRCHALSVPLPQKFPADPFREVQFPELPDLLCTGLPDPPDSFFPSLLHEIIKRNIDLLIFQIKLRK